VREISPKPRIGCIKIQPLIFQLVRHRLNEPLTGMRLALPFTITALAVFATGCTTNYFQEFHGEIHNADSTNQTAALRCDIYGDCEGPSVTGGRFASFDVGSPANFAIYLSYPTTSSRRTFHTAPPRVDAWLVYTHGNLDTDLEDSQFDDSNDVSDLRLFGGKQLTGTLTESRNDSADFNIAVDLTATNGDAVRGEFIGYTKTKFDPGSILIGLGMLFFGEGGPSTGVNTNLPTIGGPTIQDSDELETPTYRIIFARHPESKASSKDVQCACVNKKDGKTINLAGKTIPTKGRGVFGYVFQNGETIYMIGDDGEFLITKGSKTLVDEQGTWK
jgi:hypothetical protein